MQSISGDFRTMSTVLFRSLNRSVSISQILSLSRPRLNSSRISQIALDTVLRNRSFDGYLPAPEFKEEEMMRTIAIAEEPFYKEKIEAFLAAVANKEVGLETPFRAIAYRIFKDNNEDAEVSQDLGTNMQSFIYKTVEAPLLYFAKETVKLILEGSGDTIEIEVNYNLAPKLFAETMEGDSPALIEWIEEAISQLAAKLFNSMEGFSVTELRPVIKDGFKFLSFLMVHVQDVNQTRKALKSESYLRDLFGRVFAIRLPHTNSLSEGHTKLFEKHDKLVAEMKRAIENGDKRGIGRLLPLLVAFYEKASERFAEEEMEYLVKEGKAVMDQLYRQYAERLLEQIELDPLKRDVQGGEEIVLLNNYSQAVGDIADVIGDKSDPMPLSEMEVIAQAVVLLNYQLDSRCTITPCKWMRGGEAFLCLKVTRDT